MINLLMDADDKEVRVQQIAEKLLEADSHSDVFTMETQEEYDLLFDAVNEGVLSPAFNIGRSGLWLNKKRIHPPTAIVFH
jgi:hypothetical protein